MKLVFVIGTVAMLSSATALAQAPKGAPAAPSTPSSNAPAAPSKAVEPAATPAAKPAEPAPAAKPAESTSVKPASARPKRTRDNRDARECLKLDTNREIAACSRKYL
jgi:hypothetical protein